MEKVEALDVAAIIVNILFFRISVFRIEVWDKSSLLS
jgi:hypothetical protein